MATALLYTYQLLAMFQLLPLEAHVNLCTLLYTASSRASTVAPWTPVQVT